MSATFLRLLVLAALVVPLVLTVRARGGSLACSRAVHADLEQGWAYYRAGSTDSARVRFATVLERCSTHTGAQTGLGYVALRAGDTGEARRRFETVVASERDHVDALVGLGLAAWRAGDLETVYTVFTRVREMEPENKEARTYLARVPAGFGPPPKRVPLVLPDSVVYPARTQGDRFEIRTRNGWQPFYVKGVNLGAALPGKHASEFPDSGTYARWFRQIGAMGANTVRTYTLHPPHFYGALRAHNTAHPDRPLWLMQGVWAELPPSDNYDHTEWRAGFVRDLHTAVDVIHGRADVRPRAGRAAGFYTADVSPWGLGWILGREWEAHSVAAYNQMRPGRRGWSGRFLRVEGGTPMDAWMGEATEEIVAYEMRRYRAQRPVAYTNWPTTDPLTHPTESTIMEEAAIRTALGERTDIRPVVDGDDAVALDAQRVRPTAAFPAGYFAAYHVYPYFPDFMVLDPGLNRARSSIGPSNYSGYLRRLKAHHPDRPVLIAEYGVPASLGIAHLQPQGWHHGGNTEAEMARVNARLTHEIAEAGMAGGIVFEWIDEWFKKTWNTADMEAPRERDRLWYNRMDAEEHYGIVAMESPGAVRGATLGQRLPAWRQQPALYTGQDGARVRAAADEAYLWLLFERGDAPAWEELLVGFDILDPRAGDFHWPGRVGTRLPVGVEFVLQVRHGEARLLVDPPYAADRVVPQGTATRGTPAAGPSISEPPPGFFRGRFARVRNSPAVPRPNTDGRYEALRVLTSRTRFGRDSTEFAAMGYDWGVLRPGPLPDGNWEQLEREGVFEVRIPWTLLNIADPSQRLALFEPVATPEGTPRGTTAIDAIRVVAAARASGTGWRSWPVSGMADDVASFSWPTWEVPRWRARTRPVYGALRDAFSTLNPPVVQ